MVVPPIPRYLPQYNFSPSGGARRSLIGFSVCAVSRMPEPAAIAWVPAVLPMTSTSMPNRSRVRRGGATAYDGLPQLLVYRHSRFFKTALQNPRALPR